MPIDITVPRLGWSMDEGTFAEWLKQDGEFVRRGDMLFVLEGDKAAQEIESFDEGFLQLSPTGPRPGDVVRVGQVLACLLSAVEHQRRMLGVTTGETAVPRSAAGTAATGTAADTAADAATADPRTTSSAAPPVPGTGAATAGPALRRLARELQVDLSQLTGSGRGGRITEEDVRGAAEYSSAPAANSGVATPRARRTAQQLGLDWRTVRGTGRDGRVRERDVQQAAQSQTVRPAAGRGAVQADVAPHRPVTASVGTARPATAPAAMSRQPLSGSRRTIARRMLESHLSHAPVTLTTTADATNLVNLREQFKAAAGAADDVLPGYTDLIIKLTAGALQAHPQLNARWEDDTIVLCADVHIGMAVDTDHGLLVPVLRDVPQLSLRNLVRQSRQLIAQARAGQLQAEDMQAGTFTVTSLGALGVDAFTPIINGAQCAILGVGRIQKQPVYQQDQLVPREIMTLSLTFDHRQVDGAPAARFLQAVVQAIQNPARFLIE